MYSVLYDIEKKYFIIISSADKVLTSYKRNTDTAILLSTSVAYISSKYKYDTLDSVLKTIESYIRNKSQNKSDAIKNYYWISLSENFTSSKYLKKIISAKSMPKLYKRLKYNLELFNKQINFLNKLQAI